MPPPRSPDRYPLRTRSSVIVLVMITLLFTAVALTAFIEKASVDLRVDVREADDRRLRQEAYNALEVTLAVLEDFRQADSGLHSQAEGWGDPLTWAGWSPADGRTVEVSFDDESGKIPLSKVDLPTLENLFTFWKMPPDDAERLGDAIMGWMQPGYVYSTPINVDYEQGEIPYDAPGRPIRAFSELLAIDVAKDYFADEKGKPNDAYWRFVNDFSIFAFKQPNVNAANPDVLAAVGQFNEAQGQRIQDYRSGTGQFAQQGQQYFQDNSTIATVAGPGGNATPFGTTITALRITITVHQGRSDFRLSAVIAPQGGATLNTTLAANATAGLPATSSAGTTPGGAVSPAGAPGAAPATTGTNASTPTSAPALNYPFTILELLENDQIPHQPAPPPAAPA